MLFQLHLSVEYPNWFLLIYKFCPAVAKDSDSFARKSLLDGLKLRYYKNVI